MKIQKQKPIDFTGNWESHPCSKYIGHEITTRPYKKWALTTASFIVLTGFVFWIIPMINPFTMGLTAIKFLGRFG